MKKYKQFHAEQQYITEVGPFASAMMTAMAVTGLGVAGWKLFKAGKEKIKGYKETKAEKKDNKDNGVYIDLKTWDDDAGKITTTPTLIAKAGTSKANMSNDEIEKERKKRQAKLDPTNSRQQAEWELKNKEKEDSAAKEDEKEKEERGGIEDVKDAEEYFKNNDEAPPGWRNAGDKDKPELMTTKDYNKELERRKRTKKKEQPAQKTGGGSSNGAGQGTTTGQDTSAADKLLRRNSKLLKFGEFISEGVMNDLLKAGKSKKDSEISLDDGADIPIDPLTSQILVKYIEGLSSSEKNRTIQQIQRTERAFMKVLGKAHENT